MGNIEKSSAQEKSSVYSVDVKNEVAFAGGKNSNKKKYKGGGGVIMFFGAVITLAVFSSVSQNTEAVIVDEPAFVTETAETTAGSTQKPPVAAENNLVSAPEPPVATESRAVSAPDPVSPAITTAEPATVSATEPIQLSQKTAENPLAAFNEVIYQYDFTALSEAPLPTWQQVGEGQCYYQHPDGITVANGTVPMQKCVLFHDIVSTDYKKIELKASLADQTAAGIVILRDTEQPLQDDHHYYRFMVDLGIGGSYRAVIQEVYLDEVGNLAVRELASREYAYDPAKVYTLALLRGDTGFDFYVRENDRSPVKINPEPVTIPYSTLDKLGFKITDDTPGDENRVMIKHFGLSS